MWVLGLPQSLQVGVEASANDMTQVAIFLSHVLCPSEKERQEKAKHAGCSRLNNHLSSYDRRKSHLGNIFLFEFL